MLFITSGFSLIIIIITTITTNIVISFVGKTIDAPVYGFGGVFYAFNKTSHEEINSTSFKDFWEYPIVWCELWNKYENYTDVIIKVTETLIKPPCTYIDNRLDIIHNDVHKYQYMNWLAIVLSMIDLIAMLLIDRWLIINTYVIKNIHMIANTYWISVLFQLASFVLVTINIVYLQTYIIGDVLWISTEDPVKDSILNIFKCQLCIMVIFNIFISAIHKTYYMYKKVKETSEENRILIS